MMRAWTYAAGLLLVMSPTSACSDVPSGTEGDCSAKIGWGGEVYRSHNELNPDAPRGEPLGTGDVLDCEGASIDTVEVFAVDGADSALAIIATGDWPGVYVLEGAPTSSWPEALKTP